MAGCRDCERCTETAAKGLITAIPRMIIWILTCWNIGLFQKKCPQCDHKMVAHQRRADGSFQD
jgi:hypothetical protein|tara:strand:- start:257 stop:445 length:189 start_codon:yes stop_codon:yes gene_type:complete